MCSAKRRAGGSGFRVLGALSVESALVVRGSPKPPRFLETSFPNRPGKYKVKFSDFYYLIRTKKFKGRVLGN